MKVIVGGLDGAKMWRISLCICTKDIAKVIKGIRTVLEKNGARCDVIDFYKIESF